MKKDLLANSFNSNVNLEAGPVCALCDEVGAGGVFESADDAVGCDVGAVSTTVEVGGTTEVKEGRAVTTR